MRQIRLELYIGFADAPRAYDNLKFRLNEFDEDEVTDRLRVWAREILRELDEMRADDDTTDN